MKILIATDITLRICGNRIYARNKYSTIFRRYNNSFGKIVFCCRTEAIDEIVDDCDDITDITDKVIPANSLLKGLIGKYNKSLKSAIKDCDLVICRCPSIYAYRAADCARSLNKPYLTESMGCAWDAYWNHGLTGKVIAPYMFFKMKEVVKHADYASYVTSKFLQKRYPRKGNNLAASNVLIKSVDDSILERRVKHIENSHENLVTLMTTAAVNVKYKGQQYVIKAIPEINKAGIRVKYYIVGEGDQSYLKAVVKKYGVDDQVFFMGRLPLEHVMDLLDDTDIYIQPSLQEGLPRSVIEALSRGCISLGANTAGIPELLVDKYVLQRKSVKDITQKIISICNSPLEVKIENAKRNFEFSKQFLSGVLDMKRKEYYCLIKKEIGEGNAK